MQSTTTAFAIDDDLEASIASGIQAVGDILLAPSVVPAQEAVAHLALKVHQDASLLMISRAEYSLTASQHRDSGDDKLSGAELRAHRYPALLQRGLLMLSKQRRIAQNFCGISIPRRNP